MVDVAVVEGNLPAVGGTLVEVVHTEGGPLHHALLALLCTPQ